MRKEDFHNQLLAATFAAMRFGQNYVTNRLSDNITYVVLLNQSCDEHRKEDEIVYPEDKGKVHVDLSEMDVVDILHRDNCCPQWIDISVAGAQKNLTLLRLICCGRYLADETRMYYYERGTQPFGIKSSNLPHFDPNSDKEIKKFKLKKPSKALKEIIAQNLMIFGKPEA